MITITQGQIKQTQKFIKE